MQNLLFQHCVIKVYLSAKCTAKWDLPPFLSFIGSSLDPGTWRVRCCLQRVLPYFHISRAQTSWPCLTNPIPPAAQIFLPSKRMAGASTKEHTFPLRACLSLHPKLLLSLPNAAASQTAGDAVAVSRTEFHALLFVNALEKTVQILSQTTHELMTRKKMMMFLVYENFGHIL